MSNWLCPKCRAVNFSSGSCGCCAYDGITITTGLATMAQAIVTPDSKAQLLSDTHTTLDKVWVVVTIFSGVIDDTQAFATEQAAERYFLNNLGFSYDAMIEYLGMFGVEDTTQLEEQWPALAYCNFENNDFYIYELTLLKEV